MKYNNCNNTPSLKKIIDESKKGLHSVLKIQCEKCCALIPVETGRLHNVNRQAKTYLMNQTHNDVTTNAVLGTLNAEVGCMELNKILSCLDVSTISPKLYKKYEKEIGPIIEEEARKSCTKAAQTEQKLVIEKLHELQKEL